MVFRMLITPLGKLIPLCKLGDNKALPQNEQQKKKQQHTNAGKEKLTNKTH